MPWLRECSICFDLNPYSKNTRTKWRLDFDVDATEVQHLKVDSFQLVAGAKLSCINCSIIMEGLNTMSRNLALFDSSKPFGMDIYKRHKYPLRVEVTPFEQEEADLNGEKSSVLKSLSSWSDLKRHAKRKNPQRLKVRYQKPIQFEYHMLPGQTSVQNSNARLGRFDMAEGVHPEITLESCAIIIQSWVKDCSDNHPFCTSQYNELPFVPTRLLDLSGAQGELIRLVETRGFIDATEPYATLSHRWGDAHFIQTNQQTLQKHKIGIEICELPRTFVDTVTILPTLRIQYLWIDSLCIIQKDDADWKTQAAQMARIYSRGCLNIAATAAEDSTEGCLNTRSLKHGQISDPRSFPIDINECSHERLVYIRPSFYSLHQRFNIRMRNRHTDPADHEITSLLSRAWVFQERQLAPRTIHFHPTELIMECKTDLRCECTGLENLYETSRSKLPGIHSLDNRQILDRWLGLINEYSKLLITYDKDRLVALTGIAKTFQDRLDSHYLAGIWLGDLARGLLWNTAKPLRFEKGYNENVYRLASELKFAPSWSWASLVSVGKNTPINYLVLYEDTFKAHKHFGYIHTNIPRMVVDSLKNKEPGYLIVRGLTITARLSHGYHKNDHTVNDTTLEFLRGRQKFHIGFAMDHSFSHSIVRDGEDVYCLLVGTSNKGSNSLGRRADWLQFLVCKLYQSSGVYERVGIYRCTSSRQALKGSQERVMKLI